MSVKKEKGNGANRSRFVGEYEHKKLDCVRK